MATRAHTLSQLWSSQTGETDIDKLKRTNQRKNHWAGFRRGLPRKKFLRMTTEVREIFKAQRDKRRQNKLDFFNETGKDLYQVDDLINIDLAQANIKLPFNTCHRTVYMLVKQVYPNGLQLKCHLCIRPCETIYYKNSDARKEVFLVTKQGEYITHPVQVSDIREHDYPLPFKLAGEWTLSTEYDLIGGALTDTPDARLCYAKAPYKGEVPLLDLFSGCGGFSSGFRDASASAVREAPAVQVQPLKRRRHNPILDIDCCSASTESRSTPSSAEVSDGTDMSDDHSVRIVPAVLMDINADACCTARLNFKDANVVETELRAGGKAHITTAAPFSKYGIVIDGSPCQGFSAANSSNRAEWDSRNDLILVAAETAVALEAGYSVKENSPQILKMTRPGDSQPILFELVRHYHENEYQVAIHCLWGPYFGVPQTRTRVFLVAAQKGRSLPKWVLPTHEIIPGRKDDKPAFVSADSVLKASVAGNKEWKKAIGLEGMDGLKPPVTVRVALWPWEKRSFSKKEGHYETQSTKASTRNAHAGRHELASQNVVQENDNTIKPDDYAPTILASGWSGAGKGDKGSIMWHYAHNRTLTIREAACIQGFSEMFQFPTKNTAITGDKWFASTWRQVGNAVPPPIAKAVAAHILESAENDDNVEDALQQFLEENREPK